MLRPYGKPLIAALEALAACQPATVAQIRGHMPAGLEDGVAHSCCLAVRYGLMKAEGDRRPWTYTLTPGWRDVVDKRQRDSMPAVKPPRSADGVPEDLTVVTVASALASRSLLEQAWAAVR